MRTLKEFNLNFRTAENAIKTMGTILILIAGAALTINMFINPVEFKF